MTRLKAQVLAALRVFQSRSRWRLTNQLIFDLHDNGGGEPGMVAWLSSYIFDARTRLNDLYERKRNKTTEY